MLSLWQQYFDLLIHPFYSHALSRRERHEQGAENVRGLFDKSSDQENSPDSLDFLGLMSLSWPFYIMRACYLIVGIYLSGQVINSEFSSKGIVNFFSGGYHFEFEQYLLYTTLLWVVLFPIGAWITMKFWSLLLNFFAKLFQIEEEHLGEVCDEVSRGALVSNFFLIVPFIGDLLKQVSSWVYLYAGCRSNLGLSRLQSFIIIVSPVILMGALLVFMSAYFALIISVLI